MFRPVVTTPPLPARPPRAVTAALLLTVAVAVASAASLVLSADRASAAFPGRNGVIAYEASGSTRGVIYARRPGSRALSRFYAGGRVGDPAFSPAGRRLAVTRSGAIWTMYLDGTILRKLTVPGAPETEPGWSPRGDEIAFTAGTGDRRRIWAIGADGLGLRQLSRSGSADHAAAWSVRDAVAFVRRTPKGHDDIFTMDRAGGHATRLTKDKADEEAPAWSPDGGRLAFVRGKDVFVMDARGKHARRLTRDLSASSPAWSPDGLSIAFTARKGSRRQLYVIAARGGRARALTSGASSPQAPDWQPADADPVIAAAGDIACDPADAAFRAGAGTSTACHQGRTSDVLLRMDLAGILMLGDGQYQRGRLDAFMGSFDPSWGRLKPLIHPVAGNHEYLTPGAAGYYDYFNGVGRDDGPAGRRSQGWYSFDIGTWHVVALNSAICMLDASTCAPGSPQEQWLRADLAAHPAQCTLAYWHHPLFSSALEGQAPEVRPLWQALADAGADVVLAGHAHVYERFAPQTVDGAPDERGMREFVVGSGGKNRQNFLPVLAANSEMRDRRSFGVLRLTLHAGAYDWSFVPSAGSPRFRDDGTATCH